MRRQRPRTIRDIRAINIICGAVADYYGVTGPELRQNAGRQYLRALSRHVAMHLIRTTVRTTSLEEIGEIFGNDHTTVMHALKRVRSSPVIQRDVEHIRAVMSGEPRPEHNGHLPRFRPTDVTTVVLELYQLTIGELLTNERGHRKVRAYETVVAALRAFTPMSYPDIRDHLCKQYHSGVVCAHERWHRRNAEDRARTLDHIKRMLLARRYLEDQKRKRQRHEAQDHAR